MNNIQMIPIRRLIHHPENPRKDLGDLTELAESIKANGVMQNLTVVFADPLGEHFLVVIGNRRMEAAKMAGLEELPCVISDMDHRTQVATMLMENMQRADLTVYEQAHGFQMMMDLGYTEKEIGEKTGFSEKTVKARIKFTKFNQKNFENAVARGASLMDMIEISKLKSKNDQNEAMKEAGTNNFRHKLKSLLGEQTYKEGCEKLAKLAKEEGIQQIPENANVYGGGQYTWLKFDASASDPEEKIRKALKKVRKDNKDEELFFRFTRNWNDDNAYLSVLKKNRGVKTESLEEGNKRVKEEDRKRQKKLRAVKKLWAEAYRLRLDFIREYTVSVNGTGMTSIGKLIVKYALGQKQPYGRDTLPENQHWKGKYIREATGLQKEEDYADKKSIWELVEEQSVPQIRATIAWIMGGGVFDMDTPESGLYDGYDGSFSEKTYMGNMIKERYEFLKEIGYVMSDMEIQLMDGTHECYREDQP
ncbi:MAG: ParB/RepB/Spo0J family partition protein [Clostridia bacterium]|nr:ParB/RepB/Spo0J family partition protein [Clostridia bacterium]